MFAEAKKYYLRYMEGLIDFSLKPSNKPKFDACIIDSFHSLRQHKRQLIFDLRELSKVDEEFRNLVLHSCEERNPLKESKREFGDFKNLFRADLLSVFPNIEQVIIRTANCLSSYSLSMSNLLSTISSSSVNKVVVDSEGYTTWIWTLWKSEYAKLTKAFAANGFTIDVERQDKFVIARN